MDIFLNLVLLIGLLAFGVPVPLAFMAAVLFMITIHPIGFEFLLPVAFFKLNSLTLLAVPFFIMAGGLMGSAGIAERLVRFADSLVGRVRGGLGAATIVACAIFGAISGTASSACAAIGSIMIPRMEKAGYPRPYATALVSTAAVLGQLIPPSVPMILFAWATWQSVAACFLSTVIPGILTVISYCTINYFMCRRMPSVQVQPFIGHWNQIKDVGFAARYSAFGLMMPVIILGGIYGGFTTPTESAAVAVLYSIPVGFLIYKTLTMRTLGRTLVNTTTTTGVIILMFVFVVMLGRIYTMLDVPQRTVEFLTGISENRYVILAMVNVFLIIIGMLMDDFSGTLLAAPLLFPLMTAIGVHPIHFAAIMGTNLGLGNVTPPTAPILYLGGRVGNVSFDKLVSPAVVFMIFGSLPIVLLTTYWPDLSLFLPRLIMGIK